MNTITITNPETNDVVTYTESEVLWIVKNNTELKAETELKYKTIRDIRTNVRDFFSESEWNNGETTCEKSEVNFLLERIGCDKLTTKYRGTFTISGAFSIEVEDESEVEGILQDSISVDCYDAEIHTEQIEVFDIEEDE